MKITYIKRNGKVYAYTNTSYRIPGRKNPVSERRYLGVYDPKTGLISPKKVRPDEIRNSISDGRYVSLDYGSVILCKTIADRLGITDAVSEAFGEDGGIILSLAVAFAANNNSNGDASDALDSYYLEPISDGIRLSNAELHRVGKMIGESMWKYYLSMGRRSKAFLFEKSGFNFEMENTALGNETDILDLNYCPTLYLTDDTGRFISLGSVVGMYSRDSALIFALNRIKDLSVETTVVLHWESGMDKTIARLLMSGRDVIVQTNSSMPVVRELLEKEKLSELDDFQQITFKGHDYTVIQRKVGVVMSSGRWVYVDENDPNYQSRSHELNAYLWYNPDEKTTIINDLNGYFIRRLEELKGMTKRQVEDVMKGGSWESNFIDISEDDNGFRFSFKKETLDYIKENAGIHCFLTRSCNWSECMNAMDIENRLNHHVMPIEEIYRDPDRIRTSFDNRYMQLFVRCISIDIRMAIE